MSAEAITPVVPPPLAVAEDQPQECWHRSFNHNKYSGCARIQQS